MEKKNSDLSALNEVLFDQLERLNNSELTPEDIKLEVNRSKAVSEIASQIIGSANVTINAMKLVANSDCNLNSLPKMIGASNE